MLFMRVSICINYPNLERIKKTYDLMSNKYFIHATPTLMNAGKIYNQMSSCFLMNVKEDSVEGI
jgi:ribonucleotide reductase alpha subunit